MSSVILSPPILNLPPPNIRYAQYTILYHKMGVSNIRGVNIGGTGCIRSLDSWEYHPASSILEIRLEADFGFEPEILTLQCDWPQSLSPTASASTFAPHGWRISMAMVLCAVPWCKYHETFCEIRRVSRFRVWVQQFIHAQT